MHKRILFLGFILISLIYLIGLNSFAGRKIDKIKFPPLNEIIPPEVDTLRLDNGIKLYLLEDHELPIVRARIRLAAGGFLNSPEKAGLAGIAGTVMRTGGTARMTGDEIDEALFCMMHAESNRRGPGIDRSFGRGEHWKYRWLGANEYSI